MFSKMRCLFSRSSSTGPSSVYSVPLTHFSGHCSRKARPDVYKRQLTTSGAQSLVFDLRDNGGGVLDDAISCIDLIAPEGTVAYACLLYTSRCV